MSQHNRSTKGASKQRRDHINTEIQRLRDLMPLTDSVKERLFQLQVMSLACIYVRKHRYLPHLLHDRAVPTTLNVPLPRYVSTAQTMRGFLIMLTRHGKLLFISDNVSDYLGHSVEEIMCQGDNIYDLVDTRDHALLHSQLVSGPPSLSQKNSFPDERVFLLRVNCTRATKRHMQYHKFVLVQGRYLHALEYYQALLSVTAPTVIIQPVFAAYCQPLINAENADLLSVGNTSTFRSLHALDMRIIDVDQNACFYLGVDRDDLMGKSWYDLLHPDQLAEVSVKHKLLCEERETSCLLLVRLRCASQSFICTHMLMTVKSSTGHEANDDTTGDQRRLQYISCVYQPLRKRKLYEHGSEECSRTLQSHSWLYALRCHGACPPGGTCCSESTSSSTVSHSETSATSSENGDDQLTELPCLGGTPRPSTTVLGYLQNGNDYCKWQTPSMPVADTRPIVPLTDTLINQLPEIQPSDLEAYFGEMPADPGHPF